MKNKKGSEQFGGENMISEISSGKKSGGILEIEGVFMLMYV